MIRVPRLPGVASFVLAAALATAPNAARAQVVVPTGFVNETILGGFNQPNAFAFLADGRILLTEQKTGKVRLVINGHLAANDPVLTITDVDIVGEEMGVQGITVDPAWPSRPFVYLYYTRNGGTIRLVRYTASGDLTNTGNGSFTLGTPRDLISDLANQTVYHQAGCLRFGPDGMLYVSLGDDADDCKAFDITSLHGQILRLKVSGIAAGGGTQVARSALDPGDNPFAANPNANAKLVYAYGLRNPFRFQIDPVTGTLYGCDVGEDSFEEENEYPPGGFMGWPYREANMIFPLRPPCPEPGGQGTLPYVHPIAFYPHDAGPAAIVSGGMYRPAAGGANNWPSTYHPLRGDVFYTDYYIGDLYRLTWNGLQWSRAAAAPGQPTDSTWAAGLVTASEFQLGPDGSLWWMRQFNDSFTPSSGSIQRIRFTGGTSGVGMPPLAERALSATPNPFVHSVDLSFRLAAPDRVRLVVHDLAGRRVQTLLDGEASAGETRVRWDGHDDRGNSVAPGVYFARLERHGSAATVTLLRGR